MGKIISLNISDRKGVRKKPVKEVCLKTEYGIEGDAHASSEWHRHLRDTEAMLKTCPAKLN